MTTMTKQERQHRLALALGLTPTHAPNPKPSQSTKANHNPLGKLLWLTSPLDSNGHPKHLQTKAAMSQAKARKQPAAIDLLMDSLQLDPPALDAEAAAVDKLMASLTTKQGAAIITDGMTERAKEQAIGLPPIDRHNRPVAKTAWTPIAKQTLAGGVDDHPDNTLSSDWLHALAKSSTSTELDSARMQTLLRRIGHDDAVVACGLVDVKGRGSIQLPPWSRHTMARLLAEGGN